MAKVNYLETPNGARIAYMKQEPLASVDRSPTVVFFGGYASDMTGTKAAALSDFCAEQGLGFLRFDYRGHGQSDGEFLDFGIGDWMEDAERVVGATTQGEIILIGSSMGGWIAVKFARDHGAQVRGLITIAAAPDFSEEHFWNNFSEAEKDQIRRGEFVERPSGYEEPYRISPKLIEQGRENLIFDQALSLSMPIRMFQGLEDQSVSSETAVRLAQHAKCDDLSLKFVKNADHSFSRNEDLALIFRQIRALMA